MSVGVPSDPAPTWRDRTVLQWIGTSNPFYVLSAGLFLVGLRLSFGSQSRDIDSWALMTGLSGYTLLLAAAALLLVRFAGAWDDLRTVLLLVVLMFLATSVTFDELLVMNPDRGVLFNLGGLAFAVAVSEGILRGIRLKLPPGFRLPYYLLLALFFLYPLALTPVLRQPQREELLWGLFGFSPAAGLAFLTLLPAVRRGPAYVRGSGSPWAWPFYPWSLFVFLGVAVGGRSFLLCWSLHLLGGGDSGSVIFGPYFLVPFGLAVAVVLLELGLVAGRRGVQWAALAVAAGLVALSAVGHRTDPIYTEFLRLFAARLGGTPLFLSLLAAMAFCAYAALRRVPLAPDALTAALAALALVGPESMTFRDLGAARPEPLLAVGLLQLGLGIRRRGAGRCFAGGLALALALTASLPPGTGGPIGRSVVAFHSGLAVTLAAGAVFNDPFGRALRGVGTAAVLLACGVVEIAGLDAPIGRSSWVLVAYPLAAAAVLAGYSLLVRERAILVVAGVAAAGWLLATGWRAYLALREEVAGLDYLTAGLAFLAVAVLVSLGKAGVFARGRAGRPPAAPEISPT